MSVQHNSDKGAASRISEREGLARLYEVGSRCVRAGHDFDACLGAILDAAIFVTDAQKGNLQLLDPLTGRLVIRAQRGLGQPFLDFFSHVHGESDATCAAAFGAAHRVIVEDVTKSEIFAGKPARDVMLAEDTTVP
jgi:hypothetical protein